MIALGFSNAGARAPGACVAIGESGCTLLLLSAASACSGRDRLAAQLACLHGLDSFVPFAAGTAPSLPVAQDWLARNRDLAQHSLADLRGQGQLTLMAQTCEPEPPAELEPAPDPARTTTTGGADWLRARASTARTLRTRRDALQAQLERIAQDLGGVRHRVLIGDRGLRCDLLVPRDHAAECRQAWADALTCPTPKTVGWQASLTGVWPATAFWTEGEIT